VERFPSFRLEDADGRTVAEHDLAGQPSVVYLGRHPG
jgi:peroxiredoxin